MNVLMPTPRAPGKRTTNLLDLFQPSPNANSDLIVGDSSRREVKLMAMSWFHGKISREQTEKLLKAQGDGHFLIRESNTHTSHYTLCIYHQQKVIYYLIVHKNDQLTIDNKNFFKSLAELVEYYKKNADLLCIPLTKPVHRQNFSVNYKAFHKAGWVIPIHELELGETIGKGMFGKVLLGFYKGEKVVVKMFDDSSEANQRFQTEATLMTSVVHDNIVKMLGIMFNNQHMHIVTEFMSKGPLDEYLRTNGRLNVSKRDQINFASDVCAGMVYLESRELVLRNLSARNVLVAKNNSVKISDFGLAGYEDTSFDCTNLPIKWTAPEALEQNKFSIKSDMWSFGILLWEIYSFGQTPYPEIYNTKLVQHMKDGFQMDAPDGCPAKIYNIMKNAWNLNLKNRPTFKDVAHKLKQLKKDFY